MCNPTLLCTGCCRRRRRRSLVCCHAVPRRMPTKQLQFAPGHRIRNLALSSQQSLRLSGTMARYLAETICELAAPPLQPSFIRLQIDQGGLALSRQRWLLCTKRAKCYSLQFVAVLRRSAPSCNAHQVCHLPRWMQVTPP